jgi:hypothetical protein
MAGNTKRKPVSKPDARRLTQAFPVIPTGSRRLPGEVEESPRYSFRVNQGDLSTPSTFTIVSVAYARDDRS